MPGTESTGLGRGDLTKAAATGWDPRGWSQSRRRGRSSGGVRASPAGAEERCRQGRRPGGQGLGHRHSWALEPFLGLREGLWGEKQWVSDFLEQATAPALPSQFASRAMPCCLSQFPPLDPGVTPPKIWLPFRREWKQWNLLGGQPPTPTVCGDPRAGYQPMLDTPFC